MTKLRVWWIPQIGLGIPIFSVEVTNFIEAKLLLNTLAEYDSYQFNYRIKGDYASVGGLEYFDKEEGDWLEWYISDELLTYLRDWTLEDINDLSLEEIRKLTNENLI